MKLLLILTIFFAAGVNAQKSQNWTSKQLMEPSTLAAYIKKNKILPLILCVGPGASIPNSIDVGMVNNKAGLDKFKTEITPLQRDKKIVIYCGCCPFERCPNVRPAIDMLKEMKFTNYYLLNLPNNLKKDWIDKGFPVAK